MGKGFRGILTYIGRRAWPPVRFSAHMTFMAVVQVQYSVCVSMPVFSVYVCVRACIQCGREREGKTLIPA